MTDAAPQDIHIGFLIYPGVTALDALGPAQLLSLVPGAVMHYVWKDMEPVAADAGYTINPTDDFASCPQLDVICVPGGFGQVDLMTDDVVVEFVRKQGQGARYVTAVCTGSLLLGPRACWTAMRPVATGRGIISLSSSARRRKRRELCVTATGLPAAV